MPPGTDKEESPGGATGSSNVMRLRCYSPQFLANAFHRMRDQGLGDRRRLLGHRLGFVEVSMRWLTAVYAAELAGLGLEPPADYRRLLKAKLKTPSLGDWSRAVKALGCVLSHVDPALLVAPELSEPFRGNADDPLCLADVLRGFVEARNERVGHRIGIQLPPEADAAAILQEQAVPFQRFCRVLGEASYRPLLVVARTWSKRSKQYAQVVRFAGRDPVRLRDVCSETPLPMDQKIPCLVGDDGQALMLYPWVVVQEVASTGLHQAMLWYCWDDSEPRLLYSNPTGANECMPYSFLDPATDPDLLHELVGCPEDLPCPEMMLKLTPDLVRLKEKLEPEVLGLLLDHQPFSPKDLPEIPGYSINSTLLGRGSVGAVYSANRVEAAGGERQVAIKVMHDQNLDDPEFRARFEREAIILRKLRHAGIVSVLDHGADPAPYIVMELIEGGDLASLQAVKRFTIQEITTIGVRVLRALAHAHKQDIVHRDVKPSNILLSGDTQPVLVDWGIASATAFRDSRLTRSHEALGTIRFSAPEQLERGHLEATARADIYSVGRVLEFLATGDTASPDDVVEGMPPGLEAITRRATHRDPHQRFRQAAEMIDALKEREQVGWSEGGPVQVGDRVGESYDLVEAKGEPYEGCYAFRAVEVETGRHLRLLLANKGATAAKVLKQAAGQAARAPTTVRFGSLVCCVEEENVEGGVGEQMVQQGRAHKESTGALAANKDSLVSTLALTGAAATLVGFPGGGMASLVAGLIAGPVGPGLLRQYKMLKFSRNFNDSNAHLFYLVRLYQKSYKDPVALLEALRRAMLVQLLQARAIGGATPTVSTWRDDCPDSFALAGNMLILELERLQRKEHPDVRLGKLREQILGASELRNELAHGTIGSRPESWAESRVSCMAELSVSIARLGEELEEKISVYELAPLTRVTDKTLHVLAPMGQGMVYLALNTKNAFLPAPPNLH